MFRSLFATMTAGGILTTYCAKGVIRRLQQTVGFLTERLPGPSNGKREILLAAHPHHKGQTTRNSRSRRRNRKAALPVSQPPAQSHQYSSEARALREGLFVSVGKSV